MESQPQNPEFRNNPENFHACYYGGLVTICPLVQKIRVQTRSNGRVHTDWICINRNICLGFIEMECVIIGPVELKN